MTVVNQKRNLNRGSSKQEADHHAEMLPSTAWLMTMLQSKITTVCIVATCSRRGLDLEPSITSEIAYYTHGTVITQNRQWKYLLRPTPSNLAITHHRQLLFLWAAFLARTVVTGVAGEAQRLSPCNERIDPRTPAFTDKSFIELQRFGEHALLNKWGV